MSSSGGSPKEALPSGLFDILQIISLPNESIKGFTLVNVIGFIKDYQPPTVTKGEGMFERSYKFHLLLLMRCVRLEMHPSNYG